MSIHSPHLLVALYITWADLSIFCRNYCVCSLVKPMISFLIYTLSSVVPTHLRAFRAFSSPLFSLSLSLSLSLSCASHALASVISSSSSSSSSSLPHFLIMYIPPHALSLAYRSSFSLAYRSSFSLPSPHAQAAGSQADGVWGNRARRGSASSERRDRHDWKCWLSWLVVFWTSQSRRRMKSKDYASLA